MKCLGSCASHVVNARSTATCSNDTPCLTRALTCFGRLVSQTWRVVSMKDTLLELLPPLLCLGCSAATVSTQLTSLEPQTTSEMPPRRCGSKAPVCVWVWGVVAVKLEPGGLKTEGLWQAFSCRISFAPLTRGNFAI